MLTPNPAHPSGADPSGAEAPSACALAERLAEMQRRIGEAAERAGRSPYAVTLVAVSKTFGSEVVLAARQAGQADFGESRAQELRRKAKEVGKGVRWHFVGRLQRNKVRDVVGLASLVHSVDNIELAEAIAERARRGSRVQRVLVQVNTGEDPAKGGCDPDDALGLIARVRGLGSIACEGLATIPPQGVDPREPFALLRRLRDAARERFAEVQHLSMGMTADFEVAVEEGATIVRVGEGIFGARQAH